MTFTWQLTWSLTRYVLRNKLRGKRRFPLVLMLEPTLRCNLSCAGCGRIREYHDILDQELSVEECLESVRECGAPVVSITGGEPLIHPGIAQVVEGITSSGRFVHLCTNGMLLEKSLHRFKPSPRLSFVLHLDGLAHTHDAIACREGVFDRAITGIKAAKRAGFQVLTNTTIYKGANLKEIEELFVLLSQLRTDGIMVAPAFSYEQVDGDVFLSRSEVAQVFQPIYELRQRFRFYNTPIYLEFLAGRKELQCTPWSNPTRNPRGWKSPCYLITDGHARSFKELMEQTPWERYGTGNDPRCANCMVHSGFEGSALEEAGKTLPDIWRMVRWNFFGS